VQPIAVETVEKTLVHAPNDVIRALVRLQLVSGARPGEVCALRPCDLDRSQVPWVYNVPALVNKTAHHGKERRVYLGPRARQLLTPWLEKSENATGYLFAIPRTRRPYTRSSYRSAIRRACQKAGLEVWSPLQLRHTAATQIRAAHGTEATRTVLGHSEVATTEIYAERDEALAKRIAEEVG
jgi:integrase